MKNSPPAAVQADLDDMAELEKDLPYIKGRKKGRPRRDGYGKDNDHE